MANEFDPAMMLKNYGMMPLYYGKTWPELPIQLGRIYRDNIAQIPWLPAGWESVVMPTMTGTQEVFYVPAPSTANYLDAATGKVAYGGQFLDSPEKKAWWDDFARQVNSAVAQYAAQKSAEGKKELDALYSNIKFIDDAIAIADLASAPLNILKDAAHFYENFKGVISFAVIAGVIGYGVHRFTKKK